MEKLRYPIGKFILPASGSTERRDTYTTSIGEFPVKFTELAHKLRDRKLLDVPYRPGGWTGRQVIHHVADSHANAYVRHKKALTEEHPTITPYEEQLWAELPDVQAVPIQASLDMLTAMHLRWATLLATLSDKQWRRTTHHPASDLTYTLEQLAAQYDWHGRHHLAHLELILQNN